MSLIRLYMDEDSTGRSLMLALQHRGVDVITTLSVNRLGYPDEEQLIWARSQGRVLYSSNIRDFYGLHTAFLSQEQPHSGMILVHQQRYSIGDLMRGILRLVAAKSAEEKVNTLVNAAIRTVQAQATEAEEDAIRRTLGSFLSRIYYDLRNLGTTSQDRALNFASTNAFQAASTFAEAVATGMELDSITVEKSPFCRLDSDCWDVKLKFFDPENSRRAKKLFRFTIDVSDIIPVTLGEVRTWSRPY